MNSDKVATAAGGVVGFGIFSQIDWNKLFEGDPTEIGKFVMALGVLLLGYVTNKIKK